MDWEKFVEIVAKEPVAFVGFIGAGIVWVYSAWSDSKKELSNVRERENQVKLQIVDLMARAKYAMDRSKHKQKLIFRFEEAYFEKTSEIPESWKEVEAGRDELLGREEKVSKDIEGFDVTDPSHGNLVKAKQLLSTAERYDAVGSDNLDHIRTSYPNMRI